MVGALIVVLVLVLVVGGGTIATVALLLHALSVRNRVVAGRPSPAPLTWLVSVELPARLHRRLRLAAGLVRAAGGGDGDDLGLADVRRQLEDRAVELDHQLVLAARAPKATRRRMLRELQAEIAELERLAERSVRMARAWRGAAPSERGLASVRERLELLEAALHELDGVDVTTFAPPRPTPVRRPLA